MSVPWAVQAIQSDHTKRKDVKGDLETWVFHSVNERQVKLTVKAHNPFSNAGFLDKAHICNGGLNIALPVVRI